MKEQIWLRKKDSQRVKAKWFLVLLSKDADRTILHSPIKTAA